MYSSELHQQGPFQYVLPLGRWWFFTHSSPDPLEHYIKEKIPTAFPRPLVFIDHHTSPPTHAVGEDPAKPDILVVALSNKELNQCKTKKSEMYSGVPNYRIISFGEGKPTAALHDEQAIR